MKITKDTRVFITGAASGIGRATAVALAERGCRLFLTDINEAGLQSTCDIIADKGFPLPVSSALDITDFEALTTFAEEIQQAGPMDIIMNIAGVALFARFEDMTHAHWQKVININLWGPLHGMECFLPAMIKAGRGHVVNVASVAGLFGLPWHGAYSTSKFALVGLSEVLKNDLRRHNIQVTVVCPGAVNTEIKQSVELIGLDKDSSEFQKVLTLFERHALSPEAVAQKTIRAIETEKFLLLTSIDMKLFYFFKRFVPPLYNLICRIVSNQFEKIAGR
jgi:NAD(P)-dependent dehydrogenase (short-subunit alcohol dehydrogenase family)